TADRGLNRGQVGIGPVPVSRLELRLRDEALPMEAIERSFGYALDAHLLRRGGRVLVPILTGMQEALDGGRGEADALALRNPSGDLLGRGLLRLHLPLALLRHSGGLGDLVGHKSGVPGDAVPVVLVVGIAGENAPDLVDDHLQALPLRECATVPV